MLVTVVGCFMGTCVYVSVCKLPVDSVDWEPLYSAAAEADGTWFHGRVWRHAVDRACCLVDWVFTITKSAEEENHYQGDSCKAPWTEV